MLPAILAAVVATAVASASARALVPVSLAASGTSQLTGRTVTLTARAVLPARTTLLLRAQRKGESRLRPVAECKKSPCVGRWRETVAKSVAFVAAVSDRTGASEILRGRSRLVVVTWKKGAVPPPPPPAPTPTPIPLPATALPGSYQGTTSQNELFAFDVAPDGQSLMNLHTGQINQNCTPSLDIYGNYQSGLSATIAADLSFTVLRSYTGHLTKRNVDTADQLTIVGRFSGALASGTLVLTTSFSFEGQSSSCTSGNQTWQATRTG